MNETMAQSDATPADIDARAAFEREERLRASAGGGS